MPLKSLPSPTKLKALANEHYPPISGWPQVVLILAGVYNIVFGLWAIFCPSHYFAITGLEAVNGNLWQCIGMIVALYGVAYLISSSDISRYWPIVAIGLVGKVFGPIGYLWGLFAGEATGGMFWIILFNDLVWWIPFSLILFKLINKNWRKNQGIESTISNSTLDSYSKIYKASKDNSLLFVFLRHFGCTFCQQALKQIADDYSKIIKKGVTPVLIHMGDEENFKQFIDKNNLEGCLQIEDKQQVFYSIFEMPRAGLNKAFTGSILKDAIKAAREIGSTVGTLNGDGYQLGGAALIENRKITRLRKNKDVRNDFSYLNFATEKEKKTSSKTEKKNKQSADSLTLYYDEACPVCKIEVDMLKSITKPELVSYVDISSEDFKAPKGKTKEELMAEIHAQTANGEWVTGMEVFRKLYTHTPYSTVFNLTGLPVLKQIFDLGYVVFAKVRPYLPGRKANCQGSCSV